MIQIVGDKLTQWDVGRVAQVTGDVSEVHFANQGDSKAPIMEVVNGEVKIPDYLLQTGKTLLAYAVKDGRTLECKAFAVRKRERPENYIYEDDQRNYIYALVDEVNKAIDNANQAAEELREAIENGEIEGGGVPTLVVTYNDDDGRASHSAGEIYTHVTNGGTAVMYDKGYYFHLSHYDNGSAVFVSVDINYKGRAYEVGEGAYCSVYELEYASCEDVDEKIGDISTALDAIIELQEELIGV